MEGNILVKNPPPSLARQLIWQIDLFIEAVTKELLYLAETEYFTCVQMLQIFSFHFLVSLKRPRGEK